jgi:hypothetical protein
MSNYYTKRDARATLAKILEKAGFTLYGYKEDESDSMTDYYSPADWDGIATKGKYIAVVDRKGETGFKILLNQNELTEYNIKKMSLSKKDNDKIEKLKRLAEKTTFEGERENALEKIKGLLNKSLVGCATFSVNPISAIPPHVPGCAKPNVTNGACVSQEKSVIYPPENYEENYK